MKPSEIQFSLNLEALAIPQCRRIVDQLIEGPLSPAELSKNCKLTPASIEKHLEVLISAGLVKVRSSQKAKKVHLQQTKLNPTINWFSDLKKS
jgi:DNA-binding transcriptional ArsR family regulator